MYPLIVDFLKRECVCGCSAAMVCEEVGFKDSEFIKNENADE